MLTNFGRILAEFMQIVGRKLAEFWQRGFSEGQIDVTY
jgi:hypothetical protein